MEYAKWIPDRPELPTNNVYDISLYNDMGHIIHECNRTLPSSVFDHIYVLAKRHLIVEIDRKFGCRFYNLKKGFSNKWTYLLNADGKKYTLNINWKFPVGQ
jgi:hypothetical protein